MSRKAKTTPVQREILWLLAEAGERSLLAILNALYGKLGNNSPGTFLDRIERALTALENLGCIYLVWQFESETRPVLVDERKSLSLKQFFVWSESSDLWIAQPQPNFVDMTVRLTAGGVEVLDLIAAEAEEQTPTWKRPVGESF